MSGIAGMRLDKALSATTSTKDCRCLQHIVYPPSQKTTGLPVDECANNQYATARCRPEAEADNRVVAEGEDGYFSGTTGLPVGLHINND
jgi:hypothetical protein